MSLLTLFFWIVTAGGGLFLLSIWLIEYDESSQPGTRSRLSGLLIASHVLPAGGGLIAWGAYLIFGFPWLAWIAFAGLAGAVSMGLIMASRWIRVYRAKRAETRFVHAASVPANDLASQLTGEDGPPELRFPLLLVLGHGLLAATTVTLVVIVALR